MSTRSTPRAGSSHLSLPRTASFSSEVSISFDRSSSSRRHTRTDSLRLPTLAESSSVVSSGPSTPDTRRRRYLARKKSDAASVSAAAREVDWAGVEPDEVFRRLPIAEIKRVEQKMRTDALNKQSELRSMVGTRYRDLLTSATQITTLRSSSLRLSDSLRSISQSCANPADVPQIREDGSETTETADVMAVLPVAAHVKLLLDAPEALYSFLSHHAFLNAAYLWLVARVTKEGLASMPHEASGAYLAQRQWETLLPFRAQIVSRATASLRSREKTDAKASPTVFRFPAATSLTQLQTLSETILALILLDNLTLSDALALFLTQRSKAVRDILHHHPDAPAIGSSTTARRRSSVASRDKEQIGKVLKEAVDCLLDTVTLSHAVFDKRKKLDSDSMIEELVRLVQKGDTAPPVSSHASQQTPRRTSHERRASRLASISSPLPKLSFASTGSPVTAQKVLQTLPSAQILLRHLPATITTFTPFITPSSPPSVSQRLADWRSASTTALAEAVPAWLAALQSIQDVWSIRASLLTILEEGEFQSQIRDALETQWAERVKAIWSIKLDSIVDIARTKLKEGIEKLGRDKDASGDDADAASFAFTDLSYPAVPTAALASGSLQTTSLAPFLASLQQRSSGRTPLLHDTLSALEGAAATLRKDVSDLSASRAEAYQADAQAAVDRLVQVLEHALEGLESVEASLHVGRVALYIASTSTLLPSLLGGQHSHDTVKAKLTALHTRSTVSWSERSVRDAMIKLDPLFASSNTPAIVRLSWQGEHPVSPSTEVTLALQSLVAATRHLGIPRGVETDVVDNMVRSFVNQAKALPGWADRRDEAAVQAAVDLGFLTLLGGQDVAADEQVKEKLATIPRDFADQLPTILANHLRRSQLLLHPLLAHLPASALPAPTAQPSSRNNSAFLRFGAPPTGEFRSPIAVAKPGKRFGLLSVVV